MKPPDSETQERPQRVRSDDRPVGWFPPGQCQDRLRRLDAVFGNAPIASHLDPIDVVRKTLVVAVPKRPATLDDRPILNFPWPRHLAWERVVRQHPATFGFLSQAVGGEGAL
jgi:hypothetical protein